MSVCMHVCAHICIHRSCYSVTRLCTTLWPQHARPPCPSLSLGICSDSCPLSQWCRPTISSSVIPFSNLRSFPASGSFPMNQLFSSEGQSIGASTSASTSPSNESSVLISFRIDWFDLLAVQGTLKSLLQHHSLKASILWCSLSLWSNSHIHIWQIERPQLWFIQTFVSKVMFLRLNMLPRFVIAFLPSRKCLLFHGCSHHLQWFQSPRK